MQETELESSATGQTDSEANAAPKSFNEIDEQWKIQWDELKISKKCLGTGYFGKVVEGEISMLDVLKIEQPIGRVPMLPANSSTEKSLEPKTTLTSFCTKLICSRKCDVITANYYKSSQTSMCVPISWDRI